jgi:acetyl-CoA synthetase
MLDKKFLLHEDAWKNENIYKELYEYSIRNREEYWMAQVERLDWIKRPSTCFKGQRADGYMRTDWFSDGQINACYNCVDRHAKKTPARTAIIWQSENIDICELITYKKLSDEVNRFANTLKKLGLTREKYVTIYLPMIPEAVYACLACARLGIPYSVVFAGFSPKAVALRARDCGSDFIVSCDANIRGGKVIPLKKNIDEMRELYKKDMKALIIRRQKIDIPWNSKTDFDYYELSKNEATTCEIEKTNSLDPLFILYTSGSVGKPKGILQGTGGFLLFSSMTHKYFFDIKDDSVFWCSGDIGWMGGHAYSLFAPLCNGVTSLFFEGIPTYPSPSIFFDVIEKHKVTSFNTAPTALRAMMRNPEEALETSSRSSLRLLGVFGETLNKETWSWYFNEVGKGRCPIVNMWGQTELGGVPTAPLTNLEEMKSYGHIGRPFFTCEFVIKDECGKDIKTPDKPGALYLKNPLPGMFLDIFNDKSAVKKIYYNDFDDLYCPGDEAFFDSNGFFWITGRIDDVLNVSGHRVSPLEIEEVIARCDMVAEVSVVGFPHEIKGEGICAFIVLKSTNPDGKPNWPLKDDSTLGITETVGKMITDKVRNEISPICRPDKVVFVSDLPKTRSGKIMRRILRKIVSNNAGGFDDITTLSNPECISEIIAKIN